MEPRRPLHLSEMLSHGLQAGLDLRQMRIISLVQRSQYNPDCLRFNQKAKARKDSAYPFPLAAPKGTTLLMASAGGVQVAADLIQCWRRRDLDLVAQRVLVWVI